MKSSGQTGEVERSWTFLYAVKHQLVRDLPMKSEHFGLAVSGAVQGAGRKDHYLSKEPKGKQGLEQSLPWVMKGRMFRGQGYLGGP